MTGSHTPPSKGAALPGSRRARISEYVVANGEASVTELSGAFGVSHDTVRRDLERLDELGAVSRIHGGAVAVRQLTSTLQSASERRNSQAKAKRRIAAAAAALVGDGETVLLNGGTTTLEVARALSGHQELTLVSCSPEVVREAPEKALRGAYLIAGKWSPELEVVIGPVSLPGTNGINADVLVLGAAALSVKSGVSVPKLEETEMLRSMIASATRSVVVADSTKFGLDALAKIAAFDEIDTLVTNKEPPSDLREALDAGGVEVIVCP
jgi:DeoR/GlpR family transcriptional regulator of sugar metabolism